MWQRYPHNAEPMMAVPVSCCRSSTNIWDELGCTTLTTSYQFHQYLEWVRLHNYHSSWHFPPEKWSQFHMRKFQSGIMIEAYQTTTEWKNKLQDTEWKLPWSPLIQPYTQRGTYKTWHGKYFGGYLSQKPQLTRLSCVLLFQTLQVFVEQAYIRSMNLHSCCVSKANPKVQFTSRQCLNAEVHL